jgi:hypothetical protein
MARFLFVRTASALGVVSLALIIVGIVPFLSADPTAGASFTGKPRYIVNHEFKGDRLPLSPNSAVARSGLGSRQSVRKSGEIPFGCDSAFSPVSAPRLAYFYGRCVT